ncbi:hypothetical protein SpCBS45565_g02122 [Spizellomyces sp. 'palustris']|nr:hypothetical protein SpCBS45565_g02122 [Spizellomyces sp. 'palustris']
MDMDEDLKASRDYRTRLPPEDQRELEGGFSENILFACQALSRGFRIRGIEHFTQELVEPARQLHAAMDALRFAFRTRALTCSSTPYLDLYPVLKDFDQAWAAFEEKICFCYFSVSYHGRPGRFDDLDMFQVLMSETILRSVRCGYIAWNQIHTFDPIVIVAIPRLCMVAGLHHMPDCVSLLRGEHGFRWFRSKEPILQRIRTHLQLLDDSSITLLEKMLVDSDLATEVQKHSTPSAEEHVSPAAEERALDAAHSLNSENEITEVAPPTNEKRARFMPAIQTCSAKLRPDLGLHWLFRDICSVADDLQSGPHARDFVALMHRVFSMHAEDGDPKGKGSTVGARGADTI